MSITTQSTSTINKSIGTNNVYQTNDITNIVDGDNKTLVIILAVTLPTLAFIGLLISLIVCYRRRHTNTWLKRLENSSRLQGIVVNLSSTSIQSQYSEKTLCLSYPQFQQPLTKTIVYNRLSAPSTPIVYSPFKLPLQGETNAAFDEQLSKNEQQPILISSNIDQSTTTTLQTDFPVSLQAPVPTITSEFVQAIATHRLTGLADTKNTSLETSASTSTGNSSSRHSATSSSDSNSSQIVLLFSQRTEF